MRTLKRGIKLAAIIVALTFSQAFGQFEQVGNMLKAGVEDADKVLNAYLDPLGKGWGYDMGGGWYNSAKPHKTLGFDLTLTVMLAKVPESGRTFNLNDLNLTKISSSTGNNVFPTIFNGDDANSIQIIETVSVVEPISGQTITQDITLLEPTELKGFEIPYIPLPALTLSIGIIKNTDLSFRFIPKTNLMDFGQLGLWGVGVKHDFLQWLPIVDKVPFLNASFFMGYTKFAMNVDFAYTPPTVDDMNNYVNPNNQGLESGISALHGAILVDVKLPVITPYIAFGFTNSKMNMDILGDYILPKPRINMNNMQMETYLDPTDPAYNLKDPITLEFTNKFKPSVAAGLRIKLAIIAFHAQYTVQEYPMITGGFGINFR